MNFSDIIAIAFWPSAAAITLAFWRLTPSTRRAPWYVCAIGGITTGVLVGYFFWLGVGTQSTIVLFDFYLGALLLGAMVLGTGILLLFPSASRRKEWEKRSRLVRVAIILISTVAAIGFLYWGGSKLFHDYAGDRKLISGVVNAVGDIPRRRGPIEHKMTVGLDEVYLTRRMAPFIKVGDRVRVEVGRGSNYVYKLERFP